MLTQKQCPQSAYASIDLLKGYSDFLRRLDDPHWNAPKREGAASRIPMETQSIHRDKDPASTPWFTDLKWQDEIREMQNELHMFANRFLIHSPVMFLSDSTRDILLKYYLSRRARRGFAHHMTANAVRSIRALNLESKQFDEDASSESSRDSSQTTLNDDFSAAEALESDYESEDKGINLLRNLLKDTMQYVSLDKSGNRANPDSATFSTPVEADPHAGIRADFKVKKSMICLLLKPQIVLRSEVDDSSCVVLSSIRTRITNFSVRDPTVSEEDEINEKVMNRNYIFFDRIEAWHPNDASAQDLTALPLEVLLDERQTHSGFSRVMPRTDAAVQYDKFNKVRTQPMWTQLYFPDHAFFL